MEYDKTIVCLAKSRKLNGTCVAGKERTKSGFGPWIRPISNRPTGELRPAEMQYSNGCLPRLLDVISITMTEYKPIYYQSENHVIGKYYWFKIGELEWSKLESLRDPEPPRLWINGYSSYYGINDRVPELIANEMKFSLLLVRPECISIIVDQELEGLRVRADFTLNDTQHRLAVTDPEMESFFIRKGRGNYQISEDPVFLCISLGEPYYGHCYKLVASILLPNRRSCESDE